MRRNDKVADDETVARPGAIEVNDLYHRGLVDLRTAALALSDPPSIKDSVVETAFAVFVGVAATLGALDSTGDPWLRLSMIAFWVVRSFSAVGHWRDYFVERAEYARAMRDVAWARVARNNGVWRLL